MNTAIIKIITNSDIKIINALKKDSNLYEKFLKNPERTINQISNALKKI